MSWKPCRGGRVLLDKAIEKDHKLFFEFNEATSIKEKSKIASSWIRAAKYLGKEKSVLCFLGAEFINQCKQSKDTFKPFLNYINNL